jgi:methylated-DNA-[protein]-cysteine S-methyltransferase
MTRIPADLDQSWRARASGEGLVDVSFAIAECPVGELMLAATSEGVCRIAFDPDPERQLDELARAYGPRVLAQNAPLEALAGQLDEYFVGSRESFELKLDLSTLTPFYRDVLAVLAEVPYGTITTYGALAQEVGCPRAARAVGSAMNRNPIPIVLPCHRVVGSDGSLTGYAGGLPRKRSLLALEGASL